MPRHDAAGDDPPDDAAWDAAGRDETPLERLDRNWNDLLQELRVVQTGIQLLTGFLLTLPFQSEFASLSDFERTVYLITVGCAITATGFLVAPVSLHRLIFRKHLRGRMVSVAHRCALIGLVFLACSIIGVVLLTFGFVVSTSTGIVSGAVVAVLLTVLWAAMPLRIRAEAPEGASAGGQ